jgi:hypothetical protein
MNFVVKAFTEQNGDPSSMRLIAAFIIFVIMFNWTFYNVSQQQLAPLNWESVMAVLGTLFVKAYQKGKENGKDTEIPKVIGSDR